MEKEKAKAIFSKIGLKLIIPYLVISFLTLVLITVLIYYNFRVQADSIQKIQEEISIKASSEINYYVQTIIKELNLVSSTVECVEVVCDHDKGSLKDLMQNNPSIYAASVIGRDGMEITKIVKFDVSASSRLDNLSEEDKFKEAMGTNYYIGPVYISKYDIPFISISLPIKDENNDRVGVLSVEVDLSPMWGTILKIKVKKTGYVYVVDKSGNLIAYKNLNLVKKNLDLSHIKGVRNFLDYIQKPETYISFNNEEVMGTWKKIDTTGWGLITELPTKEIFQELLVLIFIAIMSTILLLSFIITILMVINKRLLVPLSHLKEGVIEIKKGNLNYRIKLKSNDEIGELAQTFNGMIKDLKKSRAKILNYSKNLEKLVSKRTDQLSVKVLQLEKSRKKLRKQSQELQNSNKELLKLHKALKKEKHSVENKVVERTKQLRKEHDEVGRLLKLKTDFINQLSHDLRTPITPMNILLPLVKKKVADPKLKEQISVCIKNVDYLSDLVTKTLSLSRLGSGTVGLEAKKEDLVKLIKEIIEEQRVIFAKKHIKIIDKVKGKIAVKIDVLKMKEVITNILTNAAKYMERGKITISSKKTANKVVISFKDTGRGMSKQTLTHIFDEFYKSDTSRHDLTSYGLGMAISKKIIQMHSGRIWAKSPGRGKGSTFYFSLPLKKVKKK